MAFLTIGGFGFRLEDGGEPLAASFSLHAGRFLCQLTPSSKLLERPWKPLTCPQNLSP
jgi:hypothetical protein